MNEQTPAVAEPRPIREWVRRRKVYWRTLDALRHLAVTVHNVVGPHVGIGDSYNRWLAGIAEGAWTFYCGYGLRFALRIAWIHWRPRRRR